MLHATHSEPTSHVEPSARTRTLLLTALLALALFVVFVVLLGIVQYGTPHLADNDGYYHIKMAEIIRQQGLRPDFIWLPLTILNERSFYDHHMLYHVYLMLFIGDGSAAALLAGAKIAAIVMPALAFTAIWWLLRGQNVPWAAAWALGLCAISEAFLYRMSIPRAQSASLLVLVVALHWLLKRRYALLLPVAFVYVWLYNAFPLILALVAAEALATLLTERRLVWQGVAFAVAGIALGLLINPYFPVNAVFIANHLLPKIGQPDVSVGNEWYPYDTWVLITNSGAAIAVWVLGAFALGWRGKRFDRATLTSFLLSLFFGLMLLKARRFIEYFPPFALIFGALTAGPLLKDLLHDLNIKRMEVQTNTPTKDRPIFSWPTWIAAGMLLALAGMIGLTINAGRTAMASSQPSAKYAEASTWLRAHSPAGTMIFQTDWDDFPRLFFYNSANTYTIGLDPTFMQLHDPQLYDTWVNITRGKVEQPGAIIRDRFGAHFIISDLEHEAFMGQASKDPLLREVHRDRYAVVYQVLDEPSNSTFITEDSVYT
jgi:hypothetical protein